MININTAKHALYLAILLPSLVCAQNDLTTPPKAADDLASRLSATSNCSPTPDNPCSMTVQKATEFFTFAASCNQLVNWQIMYNFAPTYKVTMTADPAGFCTFILDNGNTNPPSTYHCAFSKEDIAQLTSENAMTVFRQMDATGTPLSQETVRNVLAPLQECADKNKKPAYIAPRFTNAPPITTAPAR